MNTLLLARRVAPVAAILAAFGAASAAHAQGMQLSLDSDAKVVDIRPPAPADPGSPQFVLVYLTGFVLGGAAIGLAMMPSKRTHQD